MKLTDNLKPKALLILYANEKETSYSNSNLTAEDVYFEYAPIIDGIAGAAVPLSDQAAANFGACLSTSAKVQIGGTIPPNLLYLGMDGINPIVAWWTPAERRRVLYSDALMPGGFAEFNVPSFLWFYRRNGLELYALKDKKPSLSSKLYKAPFQNITNGNVCLGSGTRIIDKGNVDFYTLMKLVQLAFWGTKFNHQNDQKIIKGNLISLHKKLNGTNTPFPLDVLIDTKKTINSLVNGENEKDNDEEDNF